VRGLPHACAVLDEPAAAGGAEVIRLKERVGIDRRGQLVWNIYIRAGPDNAPARWKIFGSLSGKIFGASVLGIFAAPKNILGAVFSSSRLLAISRGERFSNNFPFVRREGCEVPMRGENLGCAECGSFVANGSWGEIAEIVQGDCVSESAIQPIE